MSPTLDAVRTTPLPRPPKLAKGISVRILPRAYWGILYIAVIPGAAATGIGMHVSAPLAVVTYFALVAVFFVYTTPRRRRGDAFGRDAELVTGTIEPFTLGDAPAFNSRSSRRTYLSVRVTYGVESYVFTTMADTKTCETFAVGDARPVLFQPGWDCALVYIYPHNYPDRAFLVK